MAAASEAALCLWPPPQCEKGAKLGQRGHAPFTRGAGRPRPLANQRPPLPSLSQGRARPPPRAQPMGAVRRAPPPRGWRGRGRAAVLFARPYLRPPPWLINIKEVPPNQVVRRRQLFGDVSPRLAAGSICIFMR